MKKGKKNMKKILALVLATLLVLSMVSALAAIDTPHTLSITNTDQLADHSYKAYQVFKGNLDAGETKLSDIVWGNGVNSTNLLAALKASTVSSELKSNDESLFKDCTTAADVAKVVSTLTGSASKVKAFADIVAANLDTSDGHSVAFTKDANFATNKKYNATVTGDGYYFVRDENPTALAETETETKYILSVVHDTTIEAKDTHTQSEKKIVENNTLVDENDAAIGDTVTYQVTLNPIPNTKEFNRFKLHMFDTMEAGLTFTGISSVKVFNGSTEFTTLDDTNYNLVIGDTTYTHASPFTAPVDPVDAGAPSGATNFTIHFLNAKTMIENDYSADAGTQDLIGKKLVITYTAVVNKNCTYFEDSNNNTEHFEFSDNPNYEYDGDDTNLTEPHGTLPTSTVKTFVTQLILYKYHDGVLNDALAGAEFKLTGTNVLNRTLNTGIRYESSTHQLANGETWDSETVYYKLNDGSYTTTSPLTQNIDTSKYEDATGNTTYKRLKYVDVLTTPNNNYEETGITSSDGKLIFKGLKAGTYKLQEIKAPEGYNLDSTEYTLVIGWNGIASITTSSSAEELARQAAGGFFVDTGTDVDGNGQYIFTRDTATFQFKININNNGGSTLPSTGGIGTTLFYIGGGILVLLAVVMLVTKRRMSSND